MDDSSDDVLSIRLEQAPLPELIDAAGRLRDDGHGRHISYSRKVFIPLTHLCRDVCHYCTFAQRPRAGRSAYLSPDEVLAIARAGAAAGCTEALFTLGDKPELRYRAAREALDALGYETTIHYLQAMCALALRETGLLPHANPGVMSRAEIAGLRTVSASQGVMLESLSARLCEPGGVHYGSPDKRPEARLETLQTRGRTARPIHDRHSHRHRRDTGRASRGADRHPRSASPFRAHSGGHRSELPRQARHQARRRRGARSRRPHLDHRRGAPDPGPRDEYPGSAQPVAGRLSAC